MSRILFVGDVHLQPRDQEGNGRFFAFIDRERERGLEALYIVGDLFDYWIGPKHLKTGDYTEVLAALRRWTEGGLRIEYLHGNRDYLVEEKFARRTGIHVAGAEVQLRLGGRVVHCTHGDFVYNKNPKYAAYRAVMRFAPFRATYLALPAIVGRGMARGFRKISPRTTPVVQWSREELIEGARGVFDRGADVLVCGHIHWPTHIECEHRGRRREIFVMGDWCGGTRDYVEWDGTRLRLTRPKA